MHPVSFDRTGFFLRGKPAFLASGEIHYFRVPKSDWARRLRLLKEAGGNCVATYVPWLIHEPAEGDIRFSDIPEQYFVSNWSEAASFLPTWLPSDFKQIGWQTFLTSNSSQHKKAPMSNTGEPFDLSSFFRMP